MSQEEQLKFGEFFKRKPRLITQEDNQIVIKSSEEDENESN